MGVQGSRLEQREIGSFSSKRIEIPLNVPLSVNLVPRFAWTDRQGESIEHHLKLEFTSSTLETKEKFELHDLANSEDVSKENNIKAKIELVENLMGVKASIFNRGKQWKVQNSLSWVGTSEEVTFSKKTLSMTGQLRRKEAPSEDVSILKFDLNFCPPNLIVPNSNENWLALGSLYVYDLSVNKEYKWRAAISLHSRKMSN